MKKLIIISMALYGLNTSVFAQAYEDYALLFSQTKTNGSARIMALGNAQTALGGDISNVSGNPAGLGFYNRSEFSFSPQLAFINTTSNYLGSTTKDYCPNFNIANLGFVLSKPISNSGNLRRWSFGVSHNRISNFNSNITYTGLNRENDLTGWAIEDYNFGNPPSEFSELLYKNYQIDDFYYVVQPGDANVYIDDTPYSINEYFPGASTGDTLFFADRNFYDTNSGIPAYPGADYPVRQTENIETRGAQYLTNFSAGLNYNDKIYLGAQIGVASLYYKQRRTFVEIPTQADLSSSTLYDERQINGLGINLGVGIMVRPIDQVIIGASYKSPNFYNITDEGFVSLTSVFDDKIKDNDVYFLPYYYDLRTPQTFNLGATVFLGKVGFLTAEIEHLDYASNYIKSTGNELGASNIVIQNNFASTNNIRAGAEIRVGQVRFRGGYEYLGDPLNVEDGIDRAVSSYSGGLGYKSENMYIDLSTVYSTTESSWRPYQTASLAAIDNNTVTTTVTLGFTF